VTVDWHEHLKLLKLVFPVNVQDPVVECEIPYGVIQRNPDGKEVPGQRWVDVSGKNGKASFGVSVINDSKYSLDVLDGEMRMTVLRSPVYAHHTPKVLDEKTDYFYMDQGKQEFTYIIVPHQGSWKKAETIYLGEVLNMQPMCITEGIHKGELPPQQGFLSVTGENVVLSVFKLAEEGHDFIIRLHESKGEACTTVVDIPLLKRSIQLEFEPWKVKTLRIPIDPGKPVQETNFLEE
jgi:alpha-mannosidase